MKPALVLLPGMDGTGSLFAPITAALGEDVESMVVRYPDEPLDYSAHEAIARAALPLERPYVLLGESFSGPIAISIAASRPPNLAGYVLCASFARSPYRLLTWIGPCLRFVPAKRLPCAVEQHFLMGRFATPALRSLHSIAMNRVRTSTLVARAKAIAACDVTDKVSRIRVPGLYLRATEDRVVPQSATRQFERLAPYARVMDIVGPHLLLQACPEEAAHVLRSFIQKVTRPGSVVAGSSGMPGA
jgi:pimeloyl-ACP methyl ester carboxylesterase